MPAGGFDMHSADRKNYIMQKASRDGIVSIPELASHFAVSGETIRRDVNSLCGEKKLTKVHGGAVPVSFAAPSKRPRIGSVSSDFAGKTVGEYAAELIRDGEVVMLDVGGAAQSVAKAVKGVKNVTFITNSVVVASILLEKHSSGDFDGRVIIVGGELDSNGIACSPEAYDEIGRYSADKAFVTASAVSAGGVSSANTYGSGYSAKIMEQSDKSILVAESEKFGKRALSTFAPIGAFSLVITDSRRVLPVDIGTAAAKAGVEIVTVGAK